MDTRATGKNEKTARLIHSLRDQFKLTDILKRLNFPKATYMYWQKRFDRPNSYEAIEQKILELREQHPAYGYRAITRELRIMGITINHKTVLKLCRKLGVLVVKFTRKSRRLNTYKGTVGTIAKNRLHRRFNSTIPHQKITTDTTEFKVFEKDKNGNIKIVKLYLDPFMDLFNREIISYSISRRPNGETVMKGLEEAIKVTDNCKYRRTFHSDQGWAYQMKNYTKKLKDNKIFQSMSRKGNCWDNSVMENFFGILKQEIYYGEIFTSYEELEATIEKYIHYYNNERKKIKLGWLSPVDYRKVHEASYVVPA